MNNTVPSIPPPQTPIQRAKSILFFVLKLALAAGIIWWLLRDKDATFFEKLLSIPVWAIVVITLCQVFQHLVAAARWKYLLKIQQISISFFEAVVLNWKSFFYSLVLPGGALGGDVVKVAMICQRLPKGKRLEPAFTIFIDRVIGMVSLFGMILLLSPLVWVHYESLRPEALMIIIVLLPVCVMGILCAFGLFFHREFSRITLFKKIIDWVDQKSHGKIERLLESFDLYRSAMLPIIFWTVLGMFFIHLPAAIIIYVAAVALGFAPLFFETVFCTSAANTAGMLPSFGGFGFREFTNQVLMTDMASMPSESVLLPVMAYMAMLLIFNLLGGVWVFITFKTSVAPQSTEDESDHDALPSA